MITAEQLKDIKNKTACSGKAIFPLQTALYTVQIFLYLQSLLCNLICLFALLFLSCEIIFRLSYDNTA